MKVLLGNCPWIESGANGDSYGVRAGSRWPFTVKLEEDRNKPRYIPFPFFLAYSAAVLEEAGIDVKIVDGIADGMSNLAFYTTVVDYMPDLVVLETSTASIHIELAMARRLQLMDIQVALCGPHASACADDMFEEYSAEIDYILVGEYEYTLRELVRVLEVGGQLESVNGLVYVDRKTGKVVRTPRRELINVDELPWPARHQLNMMSYNDGFAGLPTPALQMWGSRGCPYKCVFCLWPRVMYGSSSYRPRDPIKMVDEMEAMVKKYNYRAVYFDDDTFNIGAERIHIFCEELKKRGFTLPWAVMARADTSELSMLKEMSDAGLYAIKFGVESGCQELVDAAHKNLDLKQVEQTVAYMKTLGVKVHLTFTFGLPGETWDTVKRTIAFAKRMNVDGAQFSIATPFPGTEYFEMLDKEGLLLSKEWKEYDGTGHAVFRTKDMGPEELTKACKMASESYIYRKRSIPEIFSMFKRISKRDGFYTTCRRFMREGKKYMLHVWR